MTKVAPAGASGANSSPGAIVGRCATRAFGWRVCVALVFIIALMHMIGAFPLPHDAPVVRVSLTDSARKAARISQYASSALPALPIPGALLAFDPDRARISNAALATQLSTEIAPPFRTDGMTADAAQRATDCLAAAEWYEAGDNPPGERAVAQVVLNRARHPAFPKSVCGVVFQGADLATDHAQTCQFTFACDGSIGARTPGPLAWRRARAIALATLAGAVDSDVGLATHYHADYVVPRWRDSLVKLGAVGPHLFYRWPGYWGSLAALRLVPWGSDEPYVLSLARLSPAHVPVVPDDDAVTQPRAATRTNASLANIPSTMAAARSIGDTAGAMPRHAGGYSDRMELMIDPAAFSGSYAVRAFGLCKGHPRCLVIGRYPDAPDRIAFLLLHDAQTGVETALWNCARTVRPDSAQCLPDAPKTARMVANWLAGSGA